MWMILALVMSLGLFGMLSFMHMEQSENSSFRVAQAAMETQSAQQMDTFASAAWAYATAQNVSTGATISVAQLVNAGYLPTSFTASNPFGQTLTALTGSNTLAAYYQNPPNAAYGLTITPRTETGVAMKMAEKLSAMQENAPQYVAAVSNNGGSGSTYNQALMPYSTTAITMSANDPQFNTQSNGTGFPSLLDMVNVLPATVLTTGSTSSTASTASTASTVSPSPNTFTGTSVVQNSRVYSGNELTTQYYDAKGNLIGYSVVQNPRVYSGNELTTQYYDAKGNLIGYSVVQNSRVYSGNELTTQYYGATIAP